MTTPPPFEPTTETWSFGTLFDLELPIDCTVRDLGDAAELRARTQDGRAHLAVLEIEGDEAPATAARRVLERFAATRGVEGDLDVLVTTGPDGVTQARAGFEDASGAWSLGAAAFSGHVVLCTTWVPAAGGGLLALTDQLLGSLRPHTAPAPVALPPDPPGEF